MYNRANITYKMSNAKIICCNKLFHLYIKKSFFIPTKKKKSMNLICILNKYRTISFYNKAYRLFK